MNQCVERNGRIQYQYDWPPEIKETIEKLLPEHAWLIPPWAHELCVLWDAQDTEVAARCSIDYDYRRVQLRICPMFLDADAIGRSHIIRHELIHASFLIPLEFAERTIKDLLDDCESPTSKIILRELSERHESGVEDVTHMIDNLLGTQQPFAGEASRLAKQYAL
jgi:hypothetical protein